ncbi:Sulfotransferase family protein [Sphingomonas sp. YR710]|nr:Sulfotransferase family protein [Sphingomonas sp. YR710]
MTEPMFIIVGEQRSGTTALGNYLDSHPDISVHPEIFLNFPTQYENYFPFFGKLVIEDIQNAYPQFFIIRRNLNRYFDYLRDKSGASRHGFHLKYDQLSYIPELFKHLSDLDVKCIHIVRRNLLDIAISQLSLKIREENKLSAHTGVNDSERSIKVNIENVAALSAHITRIRTNISENRKIFSRLKHYTEVYYDDIFADGDQLSLANVQKFIGVIPQTLTTSIRKSLPSKSHDSVSNPEILDKYLSVTNISEYLL